MRDRNTEGAWLRSQNSEKCCSSGEEERILFTYKAACY
jgi:hypothetical protein